MVCFSGGGAQFGSWELWDDTLSGFPTQRTDVFLTSCLYGSFVSNT